MKKIMQNIESIRHEKGIKQTDMAERLGIKQNTYSQYITRNLDIKFGALSRIADKLGIPVIDIITYPEKYTLVKDAHSCPQCKEKEETIRNLNEYIATLKTLQKH